MAGSYGRASVKVSPDTSGFRRELEAELKKIDTDFTVDVDVAVDTARASSELAAWREREDGRTIHQKVDVDRNNLTKAFGDVASVIGSGAASFARLTAQAALASTAIVGVANAAASIGPVLASTAGVGLLIPAALAPAVGILGAIALGADGVKKAFEGTKGVVDDLKKAVSASFEKSLQPAVRDIQRILPGLTGGFESMATALGGIASQITAAFSKPEKVQQLNSLLVDSSKVTQNLGRAFAPILEALVNIASIGIPTLTKMTEGAGSAAERFRDWTASAEGIKQIESWIKGGIAAFKEIGHVLGNIGDILSVVKKAFQDAGIGIGGTFGVAIQALRDFFTSAEGYSVLKTLATTIKLLSDVVRDTLAYAFQKLGGPLKGALESFQKLVQAIGPHLPAAVDMVATAIDVLSGVLRGAAKVIDSLPDGLVDLGVKAAALYLILKKFGMLNLGKNLANAFVGLSGVFGRAEKDAKTSGTKTGRGFFGGFRGILSAAGWVGLAAVVVDSFATSLINNFTGRDFSNLGEALVYGVQDGFKVGWNDDLWRNLGINPDSIITDAWYDMPRKIREQMTLSELAVGDGLAGMSNVANNFYRSLGDTTVAGWTDVGVKVANGVGVVAATVGSGLGAAVNSVGAGWAAVSSDTQNWWNQINGTVGSGVGGMVASVGSGIGRVVGTLNSGMGGAVGSVGSGWSSIVRNSNSGANGMIGAAGRGVAGVRGAFSGGGWSGIGGSIIAGVGAGIAGAAGGLAAQAAAAARKALMAAKAALGIHSPSRVFRDEVGKMMMLGMAEGIEQNGNTVISRMTAVLSKITRSAQQGMGSATKTVTNEIGQAAQEMLKQLQSGGNFFEDFSFQGNSDLVRRLNDQIAGAYYANGGQFDANGIASYLQSVVAANTTTTTQVVPLEDRIAAGLSAAEFRFDGDGIARIVNSANSRMARRG